MIIKFTKMVCITWYIQESHFSHGIFMLVQLTIKKINHWYPNRLLCLTVPELRLSFQMTLHCIKLTALANKNNPQNHVIVKEQKGLNKIVL